jgi:hypothetical protein
MNWKHGMEIDQVEASTAEHLVGVGSWSPVPPPAMDVNVHDPP